MSRPITAGLEPFRKDPAEVVQMLPVRRVSLGWALYHLTALFAVVGAAAFVITIAIGVRS